MAMLRIRREGGRCYLREHCPVLDSALPGENLPWWWFRFKEPSGWQDHGWLPQNVPQNHVVSGPSVRAPRLNARRHFPLIVPYQPAHFIYWTDSWASANSPDLLYAVLLYYSLAVGALGGFIRHPYQQPSGLFFSRARRARTANR